jgi:hypothetical protein
MGDLQNYGGGGLSASVFYSRSFSGNVSKYLGRHSLKAGGDYRAIYIAGTPAPTPGAYNFNASFTSATPASTVLGTGASLASMLLGYPASGSVTTSTSLTDVVNYYAGFVQDDFRVNSKLTLNFGLRYEYETGVHSPNNRFAVGFDPKAVNPIQAQVSGIATMGVVEYAGLNGYGTEAGNPNHDKFGPRAGFAYAINSKTSVRGGYGLFWAPFSFNLYAPVGYTQSTPYVASTDGNATPANSLSNPFPNGVLLPVGNSAGGFAGIGGQNITVFDANARSTRVHQYSLDIQRELPANFTIIAGYSGSATHDLIQGTPSINVNQLPDAYLALGSKLTATKIANPFYGTAGGVLNLAAPTITLAQSLLPFPEFGTISVQSTSRGHALYNSGYLKVQKRMGHGLNFLNTLVWSKNLNDSAAASNTYNGEPGSAQDNYNLPAEWGLAIIDTPLRWTTAINFDLPFGKGRAWLNRNTILDYAFGGWSVNLQTTMQSGFPIAISQSNQNSVAGVSVQRPNATGISPETGGSPETRLYDYINPAAFSLAPAYSFGNVSRTIAMRGPGQANADFSLFKTFVFKERYKAQFRAEAFNLTNTPLFDMLNTTFGSSTFGQITNQANYPRVVQLGARFSF